MTEQKTFKLSAEPAIKRPSLPPLIESRHAEDVAELCLMHTFKRPHATRSEGEFIKRFVDLLPGVAKDGFGNRHVTVGKASPILWSCHVDTVHSSPGRQSVEIRDDVLSLAGNCDSNCLGADDTAGVWLCRQMIAAGVHGHYIFHRGEECGGLGSAYLAGNMSELLNDLQYAIALDRRGYDSIVTSQFGLCASDAFAESLAHALGVSSLRPDSTGVFTDTANYTDLIPECTNLSVGYHHQHGRKESLDLRFLFHIRDALISADYSGLTVERATGDDGYVWEEVGSQYPGLSAWSDDDVAGARVNTSGDKAGHSYVTSGKTSRHSDFETLVREYPDVAAELLGAYGVTLDQFYQEIYDATGDHAPW